MSMMTRPERTYYEALGVNLREAREQAGLTQKQLATALGVTHVCVHYWEAAETRPQAYTLRRLEKVLGRRIEP